MEVPRIPGTNSTYGVGSVQHDQDRRGKHSFEQAFDKAGKEPDDDQEPESQSPGVASHNTQDHRAKTSSPSGLQDSEEIVRKDEEDGQLHVNVVV